MRHTNWHEPTEDEIQSEFFDWVRLFENTVPDLKWIHHIPNGGYREGREAKKLKRMGVRKGVWDVFWPLSSGGFNGLYIEFKSATGRMRPEQTEFDTHIIINNFKAAVCRSAKEASRVVCDYAKNDMLTPL